MGIGIHTRSRDASRRSVFAFAVLLASVETATLDATATPLYPGSVSTDAGARSMNVMLAPDGTRHVTYALGTSAKVFRDDAVARAWTLASTTTGSSHMSAALDSLGRIHMAYTTNAGGRYEVR